MVSWVDTMVTDVTSETVIAAVEGLIVKNKSTTVKIRDFLAKPDVHAKYLWKSPTQYYSGSISSHMPGLLQSYVKSIGKVYII